MNPTLIVIAKEPVAGRSKTRLTPPHTPNRAAEIARASLVDTLRAASATPARRRVIALEGEGGDWLPLGFEVIEQRGDALGPRIAAAFADVGEPALLIGMDTPQVTPVLLQEAGRCLGRSDVDVVLGPALDGGWWLVGVMEPDERIFASVPMSRSDTWRAQVAQIQHLGLRLHVIQELRDIDDQDDLIAIAAEHPDLDVAAFAQAASV